MAGTLARWLNVGIRITRQCDESLWSPTDFESRYGTYVLPLSSTSDVVIPVGRIREQCTPTPGLRGMTLTVKPSVAFSPSSSFPRRVPP
jgi:hypothetical protein